MFTALRALLSPRGLVLSLILALGVACSLTGIWGLHKKAQRDDARAELVLLQARVVQMQADFNARERAIEEAWRLRTQRSQKENERAQIENDQRYRAALRDLGRVRSQLAAALAAPIEDGRDPAAAYRERAEACGASLDEALRAHAERVRELEAREADVRSLLDGWPRRPAEGVSP
jgi:hypothetical protein